MAHDGGSQVTALCFLASFLWLSHSTQRHSLIDQPRLSSFLLLFISGAISSAASLFSKWLPGADGRFDSEAVIKGSYSSMPQRPRRFYVPCIIILLVVRLELVLDVVYDHQCSSRGIEAFLPLFLAAYKFFSHRAAVIESDEPEDMWGSPLEDFKNWLMGSPIILLFTTLVLSYGVFLVNSFTSGSSYFCSASADHSSWILLLQWIGVILDATIIIMFWKVISWSRTTKSRLRTVGIISIAASLAMSVLWLASRLYRHREIIGHQPFRGVNSLYMFDILSTGLLVAFFSISASLWICETSPLEPAAITTFISGVSGCVRQVLLVGTYQQGSDSEPIVALSIVSVSFVVFTYSSNMRSVIFIKRVIMLLLLSCTICACCTWALFHNRALIRHPVDDMIYKNRVEADRWLRHATVSTTLKLAVAEYKDRHGGRDPPPNFDKWFEFAQQQKSVVIDRFDQMEKDVQAFWGLSPQKISDGFQLLKDSPGIGIIEIAAGKAYHNQPPDTEQLKILDAAVSMISKFAQHLPSMSIAINLQDRPRVLVPKDDLSRLEKAARKPAYKVLPNRFGRRQENRAETPMAMSQLTATPYVSALKFRQLEALTCPPGSPSRGGVRWNVRDLCSSCAAPHSREQFLQDWELSLDPCHQPDVYNLHDFHTIPHRFELFQDLLPLFSASKANGFNDILIPLVKDDKENAFDIKAFGQKLDVLFWQGNVRDTQTVTHKSLHGGQEHRLLHLVNNATGSDEVTMLLGSRDKRDNKFKYEDVSLKEANKVLPFEVGLNHPEACDYEHCQVMGREFGFKKPSSPLEYRYAMLLDTADGPPPHLLTLLKSHSVPFLSTIFREWYTERLMPWVHFVPIDLRFHGLHSTLAYFVGLQGRGALNGGERYTQGRTEDARWIAEQGRKWAERAIRREDMEVYLFRLLLEWGRVINDDRDNMGFKLQV
ncbi:glycosyltransferase family 90 protein [Xylariomycetidae sp. FL2044]|nr:glycosyltransferase family 90 protein [Xylariomycetidae sp. FL2044]